MEGSHSRYVGNNPSVHKNTVLKTSVWMFGESWSRKSLLNSDSLGETTVMSPHPSSELLLTDMKDGQTEVVRGVDEARSSGFRLQSLFHLSSDSHIAALFYTMWHQPRSCWKFPLPVQQDHMMKRDSAPVLTCAASVHLSCSVGWTAGI